MSLDEFYRHDALRSQSDAVAALDRLWGVSILLGELMRVGLGERGITLARAAVLSLLARSVPSGACSQRALSRALRVTPRNVTGLIDALEREGLVARTPHPTDRRSTLVSLTESGPRLAETLQREQDAFAETLFAGADPAELQSVTRLLDRVLARVQERLGPPR